MATTTTTTTKTPFLTFLEGAVATAATGNGPVETVVRTLVNSPAVAALVAAANNPIDSLILSLAQTVLPATTAA